MRRGRIVVVVAFLISRVSIAWAGVRFDSRPLTDSSQLLELGELRNNLFESLANLHSQPPLFNLVVGLALRAPDAWVRPLFHVAFLAIGLALALAIHAILGRLGVNAALATALAVVFTVSPWVFLYENWLHYDYPVALMLCLAVLALFRYEADHRPVWAGVFLGVLGAVTLTRSMFHLVWFVGWALVIVLHRLRIDWRRVAAAAAVPVAVVLAVHLQRLASVGTLSVSTGLGMNLARVTTYQLTEPERAGLVHQGKLSRLAFIGPLAPVDPYFDIVAAHPPTGVAVLDDKVKTGPEGSTQINYNNINYIEVSKRYMKDVKRTLSARPGAYGQGVRGAFDIFFRPPSDFFAVGENRAKVAGFDRLYNYAFGVPGGRLGAAAFPEVHEQFHPRPGYKAWGVVAAYCLALAGGAVALWRRLRRRVTESAPPTLVLLFLWSTVAWVTLVGNLFEIGENNRFRLYSDPLAVALLAALLVGRRKVRQGLGRTARIHR